MSRVRNCWLRTGRKTANESPQRIIPVDSCLHTEQNVPDGCANKSVGASALQTLYSRRWSGRRGRGSRCRQSSRPLCRPPPPSGSHASDLCSAQTLGSTPRFSHSSVPIQSQVPTTTPSSNISISSNHHSSPGSQPSLKIRIKGLSPG